MAFADLHLHSTFSYDGYDSLFAMCEAAYAAGMRGVAFTEHWDALPDDHVDLPYPDSRIFYRNYSRDARQAVIDARERYSGRMDITYAIELGQPYLDAFGSREFISQNSFDYILGSVHTLENGLDYYFADYSNADIHKLLSDYFTAHEKLLRHGGIDAIAHLDYPVRTMEGFLERPATMYAFRDMIAEIMRTAAQNGVGIEINTNGLRNWFSRLSPEPWALSLYREFGGIFVTTGSDAHRTAHAGAGIREAYALAESLGLRVARGFSQHIPFF